MDFERINILFEILAHCRDLPQYKNISIAASIELKQWEDGTLGDKPVVPYKEQETLPAEAIPEEVTLARRV